MGQTAVEDFKALIFKVAQEEYGVNISQVVSIERMAPVTIYPNRPRHVLGVITVRDIVMPVVDLRSALTGELLETGETTRIIVVQVDGKEIGLVVDAATDVLDITTETIQHPTMLEHNNITYLKGISKIDKRLIILLDIEQLLEDTTNLDELKQIKDAL